MAEFEDETTYSKEIDKNTPRGTKVRCIANVENIQYLKIGEVYTVIRTYYSGSYRKCGEELYVTFEETGRYAGWQINSKLLENKMAEYDEVEIPLTNKNAKVGMKVVCVRPFGRLKENKTYTITKVFRYKTYSIHHCYLEEIDDNDGIGYMINRFHIIS